MFTDFAVRSAPDADNIKTAITILFQNMFIFKNNVFSVMFFSK